MNALFIKGIPQPAGLAVNSRWIYWAEFANPTAVGGRRLDRPCEPQRHRRQPETISGASSPAGIALDARKVAG